MVPTNDLNVMASLLCTCTKCDYYWVRHYKRDVPGAARIVFIKARYEHRQRLHRGCKGQFKASTD